jgi:hypothetical protein
MNIALDVGSHEIRSLRIDRGKLIARRCRAAYAVLDDTANHRTLLQQVAVPFATCEGQLLIYGDDADKVTQLFRIPCLELLPGGELPTDDPPARQMIATLIESLIGGSRESRVESQRRNGPSHSGSGLWTLDSRLNDGGGDGMRRRAPLQGDGAICALTLPGTSDSGGDWTSQHREFLSRLLRLHGYVPLELSAPQALVLAELGDQAFTGIGLVFGAGSSQAGLIHRGNVVAHCAVPYAGHWIDLRLARAQQVHFWDADGNKYLDVDKTRAWKEAFNGSLRSPVSSRDQQLADLHRGMVEFMLREAAMNFAPELKRFGTPNALPLVVAGGTARIPGFRDLLLDVLPTVSLPVRIADVRLVAEDDFTIARGGLIRAELEAGEEVASAA